MIHHRLAPEGLKQISKFYITNQKVDFTDRVGEKGEKQINSLCFEMMRNPNQILPVKKVLFKWNTDN